MFARRAARLVAALLIAGYGAGCSDCRPRRDAVRDARPAVHDGDDRQDGDPGLDASLVVDAGDPQDSGAGPGPVRDGGSAASSTACPPWPSAPVAGHGWLYARALGSNGVPLTAGVNHVDIYVRRVSDPLPGERADANDACAVASYQQTATKVRILAAAIGFSSQEREFSPQRCVETNPCSVELPRSLDTRYYQVSSDRVSLRVASDLPQQDRAKFAAAVATDALARSKVLRNPLTEELDNSAKATNVPALDLAIEYTESKLRKKCDARCLDEPSLDVDMRKYLKSRRPQASPFELRTPSDRWRPRLR